MIYGARSGHSKILSNPICTKLLYLLPIQILMYWKWRYRQYWFIQLYRTEIEHVSQIVSYYMYHFVRCNGFVLRRLINPLWCPWYLLVDVLCGEIYPVACVVLSIYGPLELWEDEPRERKGPGGLPTYFKPYFKLLQSSWDPFIETLDVWVSSIVVEITRR